MAWAGPATKRSPSLRRWPLEQRQGSRHPSRPSREAGSRPALSLLRMQAITWLRPEVLGRIAIAAELERDEVVFLVVGGVGIRVPVGGDACELEVVRVRRRGADRLTVG